MHENESITLDSQVLRALKNIIWEARHLQSQSNKGHAGASYLWGTGFCYGAQLSPWPWHYRLQSKTPSCYIKSKQMLYVLVQNWLPSCVLQMSYFHPCSKWCGGWKTKNPQQNPQKMCTVGNPGMSLFIKQLLGGFRGQGRRGGESAADGSVWVMGYWRGKVHFWQKSKSSLMPWWAATPGY